MSLTIDGLVGLINDNRCETIVEIGVYRGRFGAAVRRQCPTVKTFWMVDPWMEYHTACPGAMERHDQKHWDACHALVCGMFAGDERFIVLRMTSVEASHVIPDGLDMVYIDGDHADVRTDIQTWLPKVRQGGLLVGDDYSAYPNVRRVVNELLSPVSTITRRRTWIYRKDGMYA